MDAAEPAIDKLLGRFAVPTSVSNFSAWDLGPATGHCSQALFESIMST
jgi:hypothetical protein